MHPGTDLQPVVTAARPVDVLGHGRQGFTAQDASEIAQHADAFAGRDEAQILAGGRRRRLAQAKGMMGAMGPADLAGGRVP